MDRKNYITKTKHPIRIYNRYIGGTIELLENEHVCKNCKGFGVRFNTIVCTSCNGKGIVDWIQNIIMSNKYK